MSRPRLEDRREGQKCARTGCPRRVPGGRDLYCSDRCMHVACQRAWRERQKVREEEGGE